MVPEDLPKLTILAWTARSVAALFLAAIVVRAMVGDSDSAVMTIWSFVGAASALACWILSLVIWIRRGKHGPRNIPSLVILSSFGFLFGWIYIFFCAGDLEEMERKARLRARLSSVPTPSPSDNATESAALATEPTADG